MRRNIRLGRDSLKKHGFPHHSLQTLGNLLPPLSSSQRTEGHRSENMEGLSNRPQKQIAQYPSVLFPHILITSFLLKANRSTPVSAGFLFSLLAFLLQKNKTFLLLPTMGNRVILSYLFIIVVERIMYSTRGNEAIKKLNYYELKHIYYGRKI